MPVGLLGQCLEHGHVGEVRRAAVLAATPCRRFDRDRFVLASDVVVHFREVQCAGVRMDHALRNEEVKLVVLGDGFDGGAIQLRPLRVEFQ